MTGRMVERLKQEGTSHSSGDLFKICMKLGASCSAQTFRQKGDTASVPANIPIVLTLDSPSVSVVKFEEELC